MFARLKSVIAYIAFAAFGLSFTASALTAQYPPSADIGQCFARVLSPDIVETTVERVEATAASTKQIVIPARYETQSFRVQVKEATKAYRTIPAIYETRTEQMLVEPERTIKIVIPAKYETYTETIELEPAKTVWKPGTGLYGRGMAGTGTSAPAGYAVSTGEVLCRVDIPAKMQTVRRTRMIEPARTEARVVPAKFRSVSRQVVVTSPRVEEIAIPAEYADIPVQVMTQPSRIEVETIPATYRTVERKVVTAKGGVQWAEVLCETNSTRAKVIEIQTALRESGYALSIDGAFRPQTQRAMESFQRSNGLSVGYMTVETVRALNINPYA
jgi:signal recognition particle subunit SEC65